MNKRIKKKMKCNSVEKLSFDWSSLPVFMDYFDCKYPRRKGLSVDDIWDLKFINNVQIYYNMGNGKFVIPYYTTSSGAVTPPIRYPGSKETKKAYRKRWTAFVNRLDKDMKTFNLTKNDILFVDAKGVKWWPL